MLELLNKCFEHDFSVIAFVEVRVDEQQFIDCERSIERLEDLQELLPRDRFTTELREILEPLQCIDFQSLEQRANLIDAHSDSRMNEVHILIEHYLLDLLSNRIVKQTLETQRAHRLRLLRFQNLRVQETHVALLQPNLHIRHQRFQTLLVQRFLLAEPKVDYFLAQTLLCNTRDTQSIIISLNT